ncbi:hypothetical protein BU15DRAFT_79007 [Melanogaster broomeanus]|nr:hypothetical protein BU15DRAFT_79007 [Melanogaster broomeanus]
MSNGPVVVTEQVGSTHEWNEDDVQAVLKERRFVIYMRPDEDSGWSCGGVYWRARVGRWICRDLMLLPAAVPLPMDVRRRIQLYVVHFRFGLDYIQDGQLHCELFPDRIDVSQDHFYPYPYHPSLSSTSSCSVWTLAGYILSWEVSSTNALQNQVLNHINISLFTLAFLIPGKSSYPPCSTATLHPTSAKLRELWVIPTFFVIFTGLSSLVAHALARACRLSRSQQLRHSSFHVHELQLSPSGSHAISRLHRPSAQMGPDDSIDAIFGRTLTYLVVFNTLGMMLLSASLSVFTHATYQCGALMRGVIVGSVYAAAYSHPSLSYGIRLLSQAGDDEPQPAVPELCLPGGYRDGEGSGTLTRRPSMHDRPRVMCTRLSLRPTAIPSTTAISVVQRPPARAHMQPRQCPRAPRLAPHRAFTTPPRIDPRPPRRALPPDTSCTELGSDGSREWRARRGWGMQCASNVDCAWWLVLGWGGGKGAGERALWARWRMEAQRVDHHPNSDTTPTPTAPTNSSRYRHPYRYRQHDVSPATYPSAVALAELVLDVHVVAADRIRRRPAVEDVRAFCSLALEDTADEEEGLPVFHGEENVGDLQIPNGRAGAPPPASPLRRTAWGTKTVKHATNATTPQPASPTKSHTTGSPRL